MILITGRCNWNHDNSRTSRYCSISSCSSTDVMTKTVGVEKEDSNTTITVRPAGFLIADGKRFIEQRD